MNENAIYYIWLSLSLHPGSSAGKRLLYHFGSAKEIYDAPKEQLKPLSLSANELAALSNKDMQRASEVLTFCKNNNVGLLTFDDPVYPERLKIIDNPPPLFYYKGRLINFDDYPLICMVGTRSCSERGFRLAYEAGYDAASKGAVIINGLALGIDGACLEGCLDANGYAVGVLGCGIDRIYPAGNKGLFTRLQNTGLILTEFAPFTKPEGKNFPIRNRVLSAMSLATVVFEAASGSGALITANHALIQGRRIFAVPGKPYDKSYEGPLELIKDGAVVFTEANDVLSEYAMSFPHRINLENINSAPKDKLDMLVSRYFKKDTDPDMPVNRRFSYPPSKSENQSNENQSMPKTDYKRNEYYADEKTVEKSVKQAAAKLNQKQMLDNLSQNLSQDAKQDKDEPARDLSFLSAPERVVYDLLLKNGAMTADELAGTGLKIDDILTSLTLLEIYSLIKPLPGGKYEIIK